MQRALVGAELVDQREDIAVIGAEQVPEVAGADSAAMSAGYGTAIRECFANLPVQLRPVGHDDEGPVPG
jgi:hypothetical protein